MVTQEQTKETDVIDLTRPTLSRRLNEWYSRRVLNRGEGKSRLEKYLINKLEKHLIQKQTQDTNKHAGNSDYQPGLPDNIQEHEWEPDSTRTSCKIVLANGETDYETHKVNRISDAPRVVRAPEVPGTHDTTNYLADLLAAKKIVAQGDPDDLTFEYHLQRGTSGACRNNGKSLRGLNGAYSSRFRDGVLEKFREVYGEPKGLDHLFDGASGFQVDCRDSSYSASVYRLRGEEWVEGLYIGDRFVEGALDVVPAITGTEIVAISENMADIREAGINFHVPVGIDVGRRSITYNPHTGEVMGISEKSKDICTIVDLEVPVPEGFAGREWYASHRKIDLIHDFDTGKTSVGRRVDLNSHLLGQDSVVPLVEASVDDPDRKIYDAVRAELRGRSGIRRDINDTGIVMGVLQQYFPN